MDTARVLMVSFEEMNLPVKIYLNADDAEKELAEVKEMLVRFFAICDETKLPKYTPLNWVPDAARPIYDDLIVRFPALAPSQYRSGALNGLAAMASLVGGAETIVAGLFNLVELPVKR